MKYYLSRHRVNRDGYDSAGHYWGTGAPLFRFESDCDCKSTLYVCDYVRAIDRQSAKEKIRHTYGNDATFFN